MAEPGLRRISRGEDRDGDRARLARGIPDRRSAPLRRSPQFAEYRTSAPGVQQGGLRGRQSAASWNEWRASLGNDPRRAILCRSPATASATIFAARTTAVWSIASAGGNNPGRTARSPASSRSETLTYSAKPWFRTSRATRSRRSLLSTSNSRAACRTGARVSIPRCGIDVYGENGIAAADIDGDGIDEIYVCQPGGLPNRLYKNDGNGRLRDIAKAGGPRYPRRHGLRAVRRSAQLRPPGSGAGPLQPAAAVPERRQRTLHHASRCLPLRVAAARLLHQRSRGRLRPRRPPRSVPLQLRLLPERSRSTAIPSPTTTRRTGRPISFSATASIAIPAISKTSPPPPV